MKFPDWERIKNLRRLLVTDNPEPARQARRIVAMQRDVILPSRAGVALVTLYFLFLSGWIFNPNTTTSLTQDYLRHYFEIYVACNAIGTVLFLLERRLPYGLFLWLAFTLSLLDGLLVAGLTVVTGGFDSILFWVFPGLIVLNALVIPLGMPQIVLNLVLSLFYLGAILVTPYVGSLQTAIMTVPGHSPIMRTNSPVVIQTNLEAILKPNKPLWTDYTGEEISSDGLSSDQILMRLSLLWLLTVCCYGTQVLLERQRVALVEAGEFAAREGQLRSAGRLAAEFAHQIKNPLTVINNAAYSLKRSVGENKDSAAQQIAIIQEEVTRVDRVITQIMGYAQLSEGRVEKLDPKRELETAIDQVFPKAVPTGIQVKVQLGNYFPPLMMQRGHLRETLVNLLQNAREALGDRGVVDIAAACRPDYAVEISIADNGQGIPPEKMGRIFEAYFTTKEKGTGLGLAIVKHNVELYDGTVRVESELGKGAKFTLVFPAKSSPKPFVK
jgi:signal transduction histidine kinase